MMKQNIFKSAVFFSTCLGLGVVSLAEAQNQQQYQQQQYQQGDNQNRQYQEYNTQNDPPLEKEYFQDEKSRSESVFPMGDWDNKQNWRYTRKEYLEGKTQPEVYREHHPYGSGGIGYDADPEYLRMRQLEREYSTNNENISKSSSQGGNPRSRRSRKPSDGQGNNTPPNQAYGTSTPQNNRNNQYSQPSQSNRYNQNNQNSRYNQNGQVADASDQNYQGQRNQYYYR